MVLAGIKLYSATHKKEETMEFTLNSKVAISAPGMISAKHKVVELAPLVTEHKRAVYAWEHVEGNVYHNVSIAVPTGKHEYSTLAGESLGKCAIVAIS